MQRKKAISSIIYVLDTNILLNEPLAFLSFKENDVVVPMTFLEMLDYVSDSKKDVTRNARVSIRAMKDLLHDATPEDLIQGVSMQGIIAGESAPTGSLSVFVDHGMPILQQVFTSNENRIINIALCLQKSQHIKQVVLVTKDSNMRLKAKGAGLAHVEDYRTDQMDKDIKYLSKGYRKFPNDFERSKKYKIFHSMPAPITEHKELCEELSEELNEELSFWEAT